MIPINQTLYLDRDNNEVGNCMQACVASILELPLNQVPHFASLNDDVMALKWYIRFMASKGWYIYTSPGEHPKLELGDNPYYITVVQGPTSHADHATVSHKGRMVHDPAGIDDDYDYDILYHHILFK